MTNNTGFAKNVHVIDHPLIAHKLSYIRRKDTSVKEFREIIAEIGMLIAYEATRNMPLTTAKIETPICVADLPVLAGKKITIVPILRAGLGLVDGVLRLIPTARVGHLGMYRDEKTLKPNVYFSKMPKDIADREAMIVDPMLATGGSSDFAISYLKKLGCTSITLMVVLASPEGMKFLSEKHPDVNIYCAAVDQGLNEHGYIVPGLGDAGDRIFGTEQ